MFSKRNRNRRINIPEFNLYKVQKHTKLIYGVRSQHSGYSWGIVMRKDQGCSACENCHKLKTCSVPLSFKLFLNCGVIYSVRASLIAQLVQNPPARQEAPVWFPGREDLLEKGQTTHSRILGLPLWLSWSTIHLQCRRPEFDPWIGKIPWRRERLPTPLFWPGEFHGPWSCKESDMTEQFSLSLYSMKGITLIHIVKWIF